MEIIMQVADMKIRLPLDMKDWLKARAGGNCRSLNGEILNLLKATKQAEDAKEAA